MKTTIRVLTLAAVVLAIPSLLAGCSRGGASSQARLPKPSNSEVQRMIGRYMQSDDGQWTAAQIAQKKYPDVQKGPTTTTTIQIQQWGNFNKSKGYWPVEARVAGHIDGQHFVSGNWDFDGSVEFRIFKDDFGKWKAVTEEEAFNPGSP